MPDRLPRTYLVGPKLQLMENCLLSLDLVIQKLVRTSLLSSNTYSVPNLLKDKLFKKLNREVENLEAILIEAHKAKGAKWAQEEPLWYTWSLEKFGKI